MVTAADLLGLVSMSTMEALYTYSLREDHDLPLMTVYR
jgi:hypothetical protein